LLGVWAADDDVELRLFGADSALRRGQSGIGYHS
jgi:hypothetical protein